MPPIFVLPNMHRVTLDSLTFHYPDATAHKRASAEAVECIVNLKRFSIAYPGVPCAPDKHLKCRVVITVLDR